MLGMTVNCIHKSESCPFPGELTSANRIGPRSRTALSIYLSLRQDADGGGRKRKIKKKEKEGSSGRVPNYRSQRSRQVRSSGWRTGLGMKSFMPAATQASRSPESALAVRAVMGG